MTDPLIVPAGEKGVLRLFALDMRPEEARFLREPGAAAQALGQTALDDLQLDVFPVSDMDDLGLAGYLAEGCGIPADQIAADRDRLDAETGWVMAVRSRAFDGQAAVLTPAPGVRTIGVFTEPATDWSAGELTAQSAQPGTGPRNSPRAARSQARRIGASIFTVVMLIVAVLVYFLVT